MDDTDPCLSKGRTSVLSDPTVVARRKRMEIRRFKKLSRSTQSLDNKLNPVAENGAICIKRARIERAATIGSFSSNSEGNGALLFFLPTEEAHHNALLKGKESAELTDRGLLRYKSLPPNNWPYFHASKAQGYYPETDVNAGTTPVKEEQSGHVLSGMSRYQKAESSMPLSDAVLDIPCESAPSSMVEGTTEQQRIESSRVKSDSLSAATASISSSCEVLEIANAMPDLIGRPDAEMEDIACYPPSKLAAPEVILSSHSTTIYSCQSPSDSICPPSGKVLVCGRRREMEDTAMIVPSFTQLQLAASKNGFFTEKEKDSPVCDLHFFAVYDGHGGAQASKFCMERMHHALAEELSGLSLASDGELESLEGSSLSPTWEKAMVSCFSKVDIEVGGVCPHGECNDVGSGTATCCGDSIAPENVGTTAIVAVVSSSQIVVANCGDSRAVLSSGGKAIPLSRDHKPNRDDETSRIEAAGGRVIYWDGYRVGGLLALSRSIGDRYLKRYVVSEPEVTCVQRTDEDECLILASDGLWDVISNETACEIARKCLDSTRKKRASKSPILGEDPVSAAVAALLVKLAYGRGSKDNISVVVVDLKS